MINLCPIEKREEFSARIISDLPEFISSGRASDPPMPLLPGLDMQM